MKNATFGALVKGLISAIASFEDKTMPNIESEIGEKVGLGEDAIRRYKSGHIPPDIRTIEVLAELGIQRASFNRAWLVKFLNAARYPGADKLITRLVATGSPQTSISNYPNLPAPTYNRFIMREQAFQDVLEGLAQRTAVVLLASLGGMGKTSLAREIASQVLRGPNSFAGVVWISDKDHPGTTNLSVVLDEIAQTLDHPAIPQLEHLKKLRAVEQLLSAHKILLVVDNYETITDDTLLHWLLRLPEPSKAIITSRYDRREFRNSWLVTLGGMTEDEACELIDERLRFLRLPRITDKTIGLAQFRPLIEVTGGNPKALTLALGCIKDDRQTLDEVIQTIRLAKGEVFNDLFRRAWLSLTGSSQRVLISLTLFAGSTMPVHLAAAAGIEQSLVETALNQLVELSLVDVQQVGLKMVSRYGLHPLVRSFAASKLLEYPDFITTALPRLGESYLKLAHQLGDYRGQLKRLEQVDGEQETIYHLLKLAFERKLYRLVCDLTRNYFYYYYIYSHWYKMLEVLKLAEQAAQLLGDTEQLAWSKNKSVQLSIKQGRLEEAAPDLEQISQYEAARDFPVIARVDFQHTLALYWLAQNQPQRAAEYWRKSLQNDLAELPWEAATSQRWLGNALYEAGELSAACQFLEQACVTGTKHNYTRIIVGAQLKLSEINLHQNKLAQAEIHLKRAADLLPGDSDHRNNGRIFDIWGQLYQQKNQPDLAITNFKTALDHYERVGMQSELNKVQEKLTQLTYRPD